MFMEDIRYFKYEESDWNLYLIKIKLWQEKYIKKLNEEYIQILNRDGNPSSNFWELERRIREDQKHIAVNPPKRMPNMFDNIFSLLIDKVIDYSDLEGFSEKLVNDIKETVRIYHHNMFNEKI